METWIEVVIVCKWFWERGVFPITVAIVFVFVLSLSCSWSLFLVPLLGLNSFNWNNLPTMQIVFFFFIFLCLFVSLKTVSLKYKFTSTNCFVYLYFDQMWSQFGTDINTSTTKSSEICIIVGRAFFRRSIMRENHCYHGIYCKINSLFQYFFYQWHRST